MPLNVKVMDIPVFSGNHFLSAPIAVQKEMGD
jgi:hypothetical protein